MEISEVTVQFLWKETRKSPQGDYRSGEGQYAVTAKLGPEDQANLDEVNHALWEMARANVKAVVLPFVDRNAAEITRIYLGLPDYALRMLNLDREELEAKLAHYQATYAAEEEEFSESEEQQEEK